MKSKHRFLIIACTSFLLAAQQSQAVVVIDNLAVGTQSFAASLSGPTAVSFFSGPFNDREVAFSFTTGPDASALTELAFVASMGNPLRDPIQLTLSTGATVPGGVDPVIIGSVTPATSPTTQILSVSPTIPLALDVNTLYWIHFTVPTGGAIYSTSNSNAPTAAPGWALGNTWFSTPSSGWSDLTSGPVARIRLSVEPVPEPTAALLGGLGCLTLLKRRRS